MIRYGYCYSIAFREFCVVMKKSTYRLKFLLNKRCCTKLINFSYRVAHVDISFLLENTFNLRFTVITRKRIKCLIASMLQLHS